MTARARPRRQGRRQPAVVRHVRGAGPRRGDQEALSVPTGAQAPAESGSPTALAVTAPNTSPPSWKNAGIRNTSHHCSSTGQRSPYAASQPSASSSRHPARHKVTLPTSSASTLPEASSRPRTRSCSGSRMARTPSLPLYTTWLKSSTARQTPPTTSADERYYETGPCRLRPGTRSSPDFRPSQAPSAPTWTTEYARKHPRSSGPMSPAASRSTRHGTSKPHSPRTLANPGNSVGRTPGSDSPAPTL